MRGESQKQPFEALSHRFNALNRMDRDTYRIIFTKITLILIQNNPELCHSHGSIKSEEFLIGRSQYVVIAD